MHQRPSCFIIMLKRSLNQRACVRIIHVVNSASTPLAVTGNGGLWLQVCVQRCLCQAPVVKLGRRLTQAPLRHRTKKCNRPDCQPVIIFEKREERTGKQTDIKL